MSATGAAIVLGLLLTAQHALAAAPTEIGDAPTLRLGQTSAGGGALTSISGVISRTGPADDDRIGVTGGSFSATTVGGIRLDTRLFLFEHHGVGWDDSNTATSSYTITLTNHLQRGYGDGEDG